MRLRILNFKIEFYFILFIYNNNRLILNLSNCKFIITIWLYCEIWGPLQCAVVITYNDNQGPTKQLCMKPCANPSALNRSGRKLHSKPPANPRFTGIDISRLRCNHDNFTRGWTVKKAPNIQSIQISVTTTHGRPVNEMGREKEGPEGGRCRWWVGLTLLLLKNMWDLHYTVGNLGHGIQGEFWVTPSWSDHGYNSTNSGRVRLVNFYW